MINRTDHSTSRLAGAAPFGGTQARDKAIWDSAERREGHYALLLAIAQNLRPEQAFAAMRGEPLSAIDDRDCQDILRMRRRTGSKWSELAQMYCCDEQQLQQACRRWRCRRYYGARQV